VNEVSEQRFPIQYPTWIYLDPNYKVHVISIMLVAKIFSIYMFC